MFRRLSTVGLAVVAILAGVPVFAQNAGSFRGTVADSSGAVLPGATVTLTNEATKFARTTTADAKGGYYFATVEPGSYALKVELSGFKTREITGVRVSTNEAHGQDVSLDVGQQAEVITVTGTREVISTETGAREGLITPEQLETQSMVGRNPMELMRILPGVVAPDQSTMETLGKFSGAGNTIGYAINGVRGTNLQVTLDGSQLQDIGNNDGTMIVPNNDMVQEVKIQTSNYAAEFGTSAVQVQAVTRSGSSEFHGTLYDYHRDYHLAANDRSRNYAGGDNRNRPKSKFEYPGFNLSGPILIPGTDFNKNRDKAFFFVGYERAYQDVDTGAVYDIVPTAGMRQGLFNDYFGGSHLNTPTTIKIPGGFPGAGNTIPNNDLRPYITPTGLALLNLYPQPNFNDPNNRYNYVFNQLTTSNRNEAVVRLDYNVTDNTKAYVRLARDFDDGQNARGLWWQSSGVALPTPTAAPSLGRAASFNLTSVLSPTTTNEFIFSYSQLKNDNFPTDLAKYQKATYGIKDTVNPLNPNNTLIPQIVMEFQQQGFGSIWSGLDAPDIYSYSSFYQFGDSFTKVLNTHAVKFGASAVRLDKNQNFQNTANLQMNFATWANGGTGNEFADVLVGRPASVSFGTLGGNGLFVAWDYEAFLQDSWKVSKNFTLEYGFRAGKWTNNTEVNNEGSVFDASKYDPTKGFFLDSAKTQVNGVQYASRGQVDKNLTDTRPILLMPRVNFAYDLSGNGETVVRGGAGIFYNREQGNAQYGIINVPPIAYAPTVSQDFNLAGGKGLTYSTFGQIDPLSSVGAFTISSVNPNALGWPRTVSTSLSVARRIPGHQVLEVGYVGTFGRHLAALEDINSIPVGGLSSGTIGNSDLSVPVNRVALDASAVNSRRPFPTMGVINMFAPVGTSNYNSLQATLSRQTGKFQYLVAYTLSRATGTVSNDFAAIDPVDPSRSSGLLTTDRTHLVSASWQWQLGSPVKDNALGRFFVNGWHLSGVSTFASGTPMRFGFSGDIAGDQGGQAFYGTPSFANFDNSNLGDVTPIFTCDPSKGGTKVGDKVLDINCIAIPKLGESSGVPQFTPRTPSVWNHDITVYKDFRLGEKGDRRIQFRVGAFNVFNQAFPSINNGFSDIDRTLGTTCNVRVNNVPNGIGGLAQNVCDPTGGYKFTDSTLQNFGRIITKHGHRVIELALKLYF